VENRDEEWVDMTGGVYGSLVVEGLCQRLGMLRYDRRGHLVVQARAQLESDGVVNRKLGIMGDQTKSLFAEFQVKFSIESGEGVGLGRGRYEKGVDMRLERVREQ
jgi:hypothetical protein